MEVMSPRWLRSLVALSATIGIVAVACVGTNATPTTAPATSSPPPAVSPSAAGSPSSPPASASSGPAAPFDPAIVSVEFESIVEGLAEPLAVVNAGDGSGRLFIAEQGGAIRIVHDGELAAEPLLDISDRISSGGERGLLGLAFHPGFPDDPRIFVDYTDRDGNTVVSSFAIDLGNPGQVDPGSETPILAIEQPYPNHNGGALAFGPDGYLYISTGDGGSGGDPHGNGQSLSTLLGKILRIDVDETDADRGYSIPAGNPFVGRDGARPEIWLTGLRNPWRMSFDAANGDLWIGDVGQDAWEEIDVARSSAGGGANYGWNRMEGSHCFRPANDCQADELVPPVAEYGHDEGCTVIGGNVYRGTEETLLAGGYLFADYCSGRIWAIAAASDGPTMPILVGERSGAISSFGADEAGELYATDLGSGQLLRVRAVTR
jgi:glucose/arabinose dehydrogenase